MKLALLGCTALLGLAACGDDSPTDDAGSARERAQDGALKFARCMREHGVDIPDPQVGENGGIRIGPGPGDGARRPNVDQAAFRKADEACREHLQEIVEDIPEEVREERRAAALEYARCMRGEGIDFPDPDSDGGIRLRAGGPGSDRSDGPNPESPAFRKADEVCNKHLGDVERSLERAAP